MNITGKEGRAVADKSGRIGPLDGIRAVAVLIGSMVSFLAAVLAYAGCWTGKLGLDAQKWCNLCGSHDPAVRVLSFFTLCKKYVPGGKRPFGRTVLPQKGGSHYALVLCITFDRIGLLCYSAR